jgi:hypothetical protein
VPPGRLEGVTGDVDTGALVRDGDGDGVETDVLVRDGDGLVDPSVLAGEPTTFRTRTTNATITATATTAMPMVAPRDNLFLAGGSGDVGG